MQTYQAREDFLAKKEKTSKGNKSKVDAMGDDDFIDDEAARNNLDKNKGKAQVCVCVINSCVSVSSPFLAYMNASCNYASFTSSERTGMRTRNLRIYLHSNIFCVCIPIFLCKLICYQRVLFTGILTIICNYTRLL